MLYQTQLRSFGALLKSIFADFARFFLQIYKNLSLRNFSHSFISEKKILPGIFLARFQFLKNNYTY